MRGPAGLLIALPAGVRFRPAWRRSAVLLLAAMAAVADAAAQAALPAAAAPAMTPMVATPPLKVRIWRGAESQEVRLVGHAGGEVATAGGRIALASITRARFEIAYDRHAVSRAEQQSDWPAAIQILQPVVRPLLPYLALPENNATDLALELGTCMMRAAARAARMAGEDEPRRDAAQQQYNAACEVFKACATASGAGAGVIGRLKEGRCRVAMQQAQAAQPLLGQMAAPEPGDAMSGHYWLLRGELAFQAGHYSEAMDAALQVVCFDNKDVDTLPDALLLSARCYEKQPDPCRARDVYYEVARLFPRTDWSAAAMERLADIRKRGLPREPDPSAGEELRFRNADDMNRRVERLLKDEASQPAAGDPG